MPGAPKLPLLTTTRMKQKIYAVIGVPGSGKTWCIDRLGDKFEVVRNDDFINRGHMEYPWAIRDAAEATTKPVLIECPFSVSEVVGPLEAIGYEVKQIYIVPEPEVVAAQYQRREGREIPKGHLTRLETYRQRSSIVGTFAGDSAQVLEYLKSV